ncbi:MAG: diguanylate cyclase [Acholeplasmatales bacterium]|nr:diguanylate cyclase [Acholeplasmatales bacterium]
MDDNKKISFDVIDDDSRMFYQSLIVYIILIFILLVMFIVNFATKEYSMVKATAIFMGSMGLNILLHCLNGIPRRVAEMLFVIEILTLFTYFIVVGKPDGFSILWTSMLPPFSLLVFGRKYGTITNGLLIAVLIFLLWIPAGVNLLQYEYTNSFRIRFPMLYISFFAIAFFLESIITRTRKEIEESRSRYEYLYLHDALTDIYNRYGFYKVQEELFKQKDTNRALAILDLDYFKNINDTYGHEKGDEVLQTLVYTMEKVVGDEGMVCRWGGDEFTILFYDSSNSINLCKKLIEDVRKCRFNFEGKTVTISISVGLVSGTNNNKLIISEMAKQADSNLYKAKEKGRNCLEETSYVVPEE